MSASKLSEKGTLARPVFTGGWVSAAGAGVIRAAPAAVSAAAAAAAAAAAEEDQDDDQDEPHAGAIIVVAHILFHLTCHALTYPMRENADRGLTTEKSA